MTQTVTRNRLLDRPSSRSIPYRASAVATVSWPHSTTSASRSARAVAVYRQALRFGQVHADEHSRLHGQPLSIVLLEGERLDKMEPELANVRRQKIGLVFQQFHLVQHLSAVERDARAVPPFDPRRAGSPGGARAGGDGPARHPPTRELSGGEQQRVCVARALINHPDVIWPTTDRQPRRVNEKIVIDFFHQLHDAGTTLIVVTTPRSPHRVSRSSSSTAGSRVRSPVWPAPRPRASRRTDRSHDAQRDASLMLAGLVGSIVLGSCGAPSPTASTHPMATTPGEQAESDGSYGVVNFTVVNRR